MRRDREAASSRLPSASPYLSGHRRGRHATLRGQGFSWMVGWTVVSALVPGTGLIAAGRRKTGLFFLGLFLLGLAGVGVLVAVGHPMTLVLDLATDRQRLMILAAVMIALGVCWAGLLVASNLALRTLAVPRRGQRAGNAVLVLALIVGIGLPVYQGVNYAFITRDVLGTVFAVTPTVNTPAPLAKANPWKNLPRVNVLLLGGDNGKGRIGIRPDTIIVASIDTTTGDTVLLSLPRNLENVPFPLGTPGNEKWPNGFDCGEVCLLNAVWTWGVDNKNLFPGDPNPGLTATTSAVEGALDLDINYYAMVDLNGFQSVVNAIGGITIDVKRAIPVGGGTNLATGRKYPISEYIQPGEDKKLNGRYALWYARSREGSTDYDRMNRQRCVLGAITKAANPLRLVTSYPALAASAKENISTDIPAADLPEWADLAIKIKSAKVYSLTLTTAVISTSNPDYDEIHQLVSDALKAPAEATATPAVTPSVTPTVPGETPTPTPSATPKVDPKAPVDVAAAC